MNSKSDQNDIISNKIIRLLLIIAGTICIALGIIGIVLPILPTTPFLLLAAACYARSSKRFYHWLIGNKWFGSYIKNYREGNGIPLKGKIMAISILWITILFSAFFFIKNFYINLLLFVIAALVSLHIVRIKTLKK